MTHNAKGLEKVNSELTHLHTGEYYRSSSLTGEKWKNCNLVFLRQFAARFSHFSRCIWRKASHTTPAGCQGCRRQQALPTRKAQHATALTLICLRLPPDQKPPPTYLEETPQQKVST